MLSRERCIVVALEHVRIIVMKDCVLIPGDHSANLSDREKRFLQALERQTHLYALTGGAMEHSGEIFAVSHTSFDLVADDCCR
jgi:hypothetical protein